MFLPVLVRQTGSKLQAGRLAVVVLPLASVLVAITAYHYLLPAIDRTLKGPPNTEAAVAVAQQYPWFPDTDLSFCFSPAKVLLYLPGAGLSWPTPWPHLSHHLLPDPMPRRLSVSRPPIRQTPT